MRCGCEAIRAIYALINLGTWVRDGLILGTRTEPALYRGIRVYHRWALHDGDLPERDTIPTMIFNVSPLTRPSADIQRRLLKRFNALHNRWKVRLILHQSHQDVMKTERVGLGITTGDESRLSPGLPGLPGPPAPSADAMPAVLQQPPTLYGVIVTGTVAAVVAYEPDIDRPCLRIVSIFDFRDDGYDVWNGFAIAFALIHARNQLLDYRAAGLDIGRKQQHPHLPEQTGAPE